MLSLIIRLSFALLVLQLLMPCLALHNGNKHNSKGYEVKPKTLGGTSGGVPSQAATRRGLGISAWGIIILVVALIVAGTGLYYFSLCYPIICKKEGNYNMISLTSV